jgi:DNA modification methylase
VSVEPLFGERPGIREQFSAEARIVIHNGDALQFLRSLPAEFAMLIITSPPYNLGKEYERKKPIQHYLKDHEPVLDELVRVLHPFGSICWEVGNYVENSEVYPLDIFYYHLFKSRGLKLRNRIVWRFGHGLHASGRFSGRYETILWFTKSDKYRFNLDSVRIPAKYPGKRHFKGPNRGKPSGNPLGKNPGDVWEVVLSDWESEVWDIPNVKSNHPEKTVHPCQFPIELVERCVLALTGEDDWVLDPYCGVGSALIAALKRSRRAAGCDKEVRYINVTRARVDALYSGTLRYRPLGTPVFTPTGKEKVSRVPQEWGEPSPRFLREKSR